MLDERTGNILCTLLSFGGFAAAFVTCVFMLPNGEAGLFSGIFLGLLLASGLAVSGIPNGVAKAAVLLVVCTFAYFVAVMAATGLQLGFPQIVPSAEQWDMSTAEPPAPLALLVGGLVGGFFVFGALVFLLQSDTRRKTRILRTLLGTVLGGTLAIAGWALRSSVGVAMWALLHAFHLTVSWEQGPREWFHNEHDYGEPVRMYSVYAVWQTGVAIVAGFMLRRVLKQVRDNRPE